jgi:hypothetical protein
VDRLTLIAIVVSGVGLLLSGQGCTRLWRSMRAKYTYGTPYRSGTIADRLSGLALRVPVLLIGLALAGLALGQSGFQPSDRLTRVGRLEARRADWGKTAVRFEPDALYPDDRVLEAEIEGARWAIAGTFIDWSPSLEWLGLRGGHRLHHLVGTRNTTGFTPEERGATAILTPLPHAAGTLVALDRYLPFLTVSTLTSAWLPPAERQSLAIYATEEGYLAETIAEPRRGAPGRAE